jgi:hypothetical protein
VAAKKVAAGKLPPERMRRIAIMTPGVRGDAAMKALVAAFFAAMGELGWTERQDLRTDACWYVANLYRVRSCAARPHTGCGFDGTNVSLNAQPHGGRA